MCINTCIFLSALWHHPSSGFICCGSFHSTKICPWTTLNTRLTMSVSSRGSCSGDPVKQNIKEMCKWHSQALLERRQTATTHWKATDRYIPSSKVTHGLQSSQLTNLLYRNNRSCIEKLLLIGQGVWLRSVCLAYRKLLVDSTPSYKEAWWCVPVILAHHKCLNMYVCV